MEVLPILLKEFSGGRLKISKRDNSSLNLLFAQIEKGAAPEVALREIEEKGHVEPGATGLIAEINDQRLKAQIATNFLWTDVE